MILRTLLSMVMFVGLVFFILFVLPPPLHQELNWIYQQLGLDNVSGSHYAFWSGFGSILERMLELFVIGGILWRKHNCHHRGCPFLGRFPAVENGNWFYCRRHHRNNGEQP